MGTADPKAKRAPLAAPAAVKAGANVVITANAVIAQATAAPSHQSPRAVAVLGARRPQPLVTADPKAKRAPLAAPAAAKAGANVVITVNAVIAQARAAPSHQRPRAVAVLGARQPQPLVIADPKAKR